MSKELTPKDIYVPVSAIKELPDQSGETNSVIMINKDPMDYFATLAFKNFNKENPALYFHRGQFSFLTIDGKGDGRTTHPIKNVSWLKPLTNQYVFSADELREFVGKVWEEARSSTYCNTYGNFDGSTNINRGYVDEDKSEYLKSILP